MTSCVACSCTDESACVDLTTGGPCQWVECQGADGLCSVCAEAMADDQVPVPVMILPYRPGQPRISIEEPIGAIDVSAFGTVHFIPAAELRQEMP